MNPCEVYECFSEILGISLPQLLTVMYIGGFVLCGIVIAVLRRWD
jgi:hypothetical protein